MTARRDDSGLIGLVRNGMRVLDADGRDIGRVDFVKLASEGQVTVEGSVGQDEGLFATFQPSTSGPDVPEPLRSRLILSGYLEVDGPGLMDSDRYVPGDMIAGVSDDVVRLAPADDRREIIPEMS